jgi:hypothetical protein
MTYFKVHTENVYGGTEENQRTYQSVHGNVAMI